MDNKNSPKGLEEMFLVTEFLNTNSLVVILKR